MLLPWPTQSRISILKAREDLIQVIDFYDLNSKPLILSNFKQLKEDALKQLILLTADEKKYLELLTNLISQAMFVLIEGEVKIKCREKDVNLVRVSAHRLKIN